MAEGDQAKGILELQVLQLQCIIDAKDRELETLRSQIKAEVDALERADRAESEKQQLLQQLRELQAGQLRSSASGLQAQTPREAGPGQGVDSSAEVLQLQCIIEAKDREIASLRSQIKAEVEAAERADKTEEDKQKLLRQLRELQTGPSGPPSSHPGTPAPPGSSSYYPYSAAAVPQAHAAQHPALLPPPQRVELGIRIEGSGATHGRARQPEDCEVLALNVSGREVWVQRSTLLHVRGSLLHEMFAPGSGSAPPRDCYGRPFLPYHPDAFAAVVEGLQDFHVLKVLPSATDWKAKLGASQLEAFIRLLRHLRLHDIFI